MISWLRSPCDTVIIKTTVAQKQHRINTARSWYSGRLADTRKLILTAGSDGDCFSLQHDIDIPIKAASHIELLTIFHIFCRISKDQCDQTVDRIDIVGSGNRSRVTSDPCSLWGIALILKNCAKYMPRGISVSICINTRWNAVNIKATPHKGRLEALCGIALTSRSVWETMMRNTVVA